MSIIYLLMSNLTEYLPILYIFNKLKNIDLYLV